MSRSAMRLAPPWLANVGESNAATASRATGAAGARRGVARTASRHYATCVYYAASVVLWPVEFFEAPAFTRYVDRYLDEEEFRGLQIFLTANPEAGTVMPGTGGFRKLRWPDETRGKGKRGGLRVIYYLLADDHQIWLLTVYGKGDAADLTPAQKQQLRMALDNELQARRARRSQRPRR